MVTLLSISTAALQPPVDSSIFGLLCLPLPIMSCPMHPSLSILPGGTPTASTPAYFPSLFPANTPCPSQQPAASPSRDWTNCFPDCGGAGSGTLTPGTPFCSANLGSGFQGNLAMQIQETPRNTEFQINSLRIPSLATG